MNERQKKPAVAFCAAVVSIIALGSVAALFSLSRPEIRQTSVKSEAIDLLGEGHQRARKAALRELLTGDLSDLTRQDTGRVFNLLTDAIPEMVQNEEPFRIHPFDAWYVWKHKSSAGAMQVILFTVKKSYSSWSTVGVHFFDEFGDFPSSTIFPTSTQVPFSATLHSESLIEGDVIEIKARDGGRQIYGILDDRVALLRLEDSAGNSIHNRMWDGLNPVVGPPAEYRTIRRWEQMLQSSQPVDVLETLNWLGTKEIARGHTIHALQRQASVREKVGALRQSENPWISSAARVSWETIQAAR